MTAHEKEYRSIVGHMGVTMLFFLLSFAAVGVILSILRIFTDEMLPRRGEVIYEMTYGILYAASFLLPTLYFYKNRGALSVSLPYLRPMLGRETPLFIFAGVAFITAAAQINSYMVSALDYSNFANEVLWSTELSENYQLALMLFTTAVVPAFVEEFLFRGVVLTNLLPYGRVTAIVISSLLFGLMHQNVQQLFYATAAGLVLGLIYVKTRSIWCCVLLHFCNNFLSVLTMAVSQRLEPTAASTVLCLLEAFIYSLGLISAVVLIYRAPRREEIFEDGCFERELPKHPDCAEKTIAPARRIRLFFTPSMIVFLCICAVEILTLIGTAAQY